ncbi:MAG: SUMF1/EgtB/PvdO family nonheme iron enzyme [Phycisphaerales bacterium JB060]
MPSTTTITLRPLPILTLALAAAPAVAQGVPPDYGHDFVTIGAPGNRGVLPSEAPIWPFDRWGTFGRVDYEYRITRTEVTNTQYLEFINTYTKIDGFTSEPGILGSGLIADGFDPQGNPKFVFMRGAEQAPANPSWAYAARYANWLHNGKGTELEDFETGVYDTGTFGVDPDTGKRTDQLERSPGSRFFLPTLDEWTKAAHYDPDRYGQGQEGYWYYPGGSDDPLVSGLPGEPGAETGAGQRPPDFIFFPAGSYPDTNEPWGLLDTSGGAREWTETVLPHHMDDRLRTYRGSDTMTPGGVVADDPLDVVRGSLHGSYGFRVGSVVPSPGASHVLIVGFCTVLSRRRRA